MKITETQKQSLLANAKLADILQDRLANRVRLMFHNAPKLADNPTDEQKQAFNDAVDEWVNGERKIEQFANRQYPLITNARGIEKRIFILALMGFDYTGIEDLMADELVDVLAQGEYMTLNIFDLIIDQSFKAIMFPPEKVEIEQPA